MPSSSRPEWTRASTGIPIDTVARIHGGKAGARQDIQTSRNRVSVVRPGSLQPKPEDEYDVTFVYGAEAGNSDMHARSLSPLIRKFIEGYNVCVLLFGATGSGKTTTLEGGKGKDRRGSPDGDGLVHLAIDELFELVHGKAVTIGEAVAKRRRMPSSKGFDFFIESSFVELYDEQCHDLYSKGAAVASNLPVLEDVTEGYLVTGLSTRAAKNADELREDFNSGRVNRDTQMMDLGSVHERTAAIFTVTLSQYAPAAVHGEEERIMMSRLTFVDMPGAERLGMDPEVLRLREGVQLNKSLLAFNLVLRRLAQEGSAEFVGYDDAVLTRLMSDALGGNCLTLMIGTVRQGDWEASSTTLRQLTTARKARNYPIINHSRARGLMHKLRFRLMSIMEDRETLRDQMRAAPAEGDPNDMAINVAKLRDLEARLLEEREEKAALAGEKAALMARLAKLKDAGTDELREKAELQEALVRSEEQRLEVSRALIDFQMETNEAKQEWANTKFSLEQRILELESGRLEHHVRREDHAALQDERDALAARLREAHDTEQRLNRALEAEREQGTQAAAEVKRLNQLLSALEAASAGDASALLIDMESEEGYTSASSHASSTTAAIAARQRQQQAANINKVNLTEVRMQLQRQVKQQERRIAELESQLAESQQQLEAAQSNRTVTQEALDQARGLFKRRMEGAAREVADLAQRVAVAAGDSAHLLAIGPDELMPRVVSYVEEMLTVANDSIMEARRDADNLSSRLTVFKRRCRQLYQGYRALRYKLADEWPTAAAGAGPPRVALEDAVLGGSLEDIIRADDEVDRQALVRVQNKMATLEAALAALKVRELEWDTLGAGGAGKLSKGQQQQSAAAGPAVSALQLENARLRDELDRLKKKVPALDNLLRRTASITGGSSSSVQQQQQQQQALESLAAQLAQVRAENQQLKLTTAAAGGSVAATAPMPVAVSAAAAVAEAGALRKQLKEFTINTQLELERSLKSCESRAVMAEEQLAHLQRYMATASVTYQREIMRLRAALQKADPAALKALGPPQQLQAAARGQIS